MAGPDKEHWKKAIKEEYDRMMYHKVFKLVKRSELPKGSKILTESWAMKKKSNGTFRARLNGRGYEQVDGVHFDKDDIASPTVNIVTVRIMLVLMLLMAGIAHLVDINGAFLLGGWEHDPITQEQRKVFMEIPQGFHDFFLWEIGFYGY
jgi:Reverse transcriptase (RNA-dependent DNA polymerase)